MSLYLVELSARNISTDAVTTLRYGTSGFVTGPNETPANTYYEGRISQPVTITRDLFEHGATMGRGRVVYGDLILENGDGELDFLLDRSLGGREITIRRSDVVNPSYPADFDTVLVGTMDQPQFRGDTVTIRIRDKQLGTDIPFQATKYDGDNVLPDGLEGTANDLKGKPKPITLGKVTNVPAVCVNTTKLIYQVHDGALDSVDQVYDKGVDLSVGLTLVARTSLVSSQIHGIGYGDGIFVALGYDTAGTAPIILTSPGGETWTAQTPAGAGTRPYTRHIFGEGTHVITGEGGEIETSPDGETWTSRVNPKGSVWTTLALAYGGGTFVAGGYYQDSGDVLPGILTSPDGETWTFQTITLQDATQVTSMTYHGGLFVGGTNQGTVVTSPDGETWTEAQIGLPAQTPLTQATHDGSRFVIAGNKGTFIVSEDAGGWTIRTTGSVAHQLSGVAYGSGRHVVAGFDSTLGLSVAFISYDAGVSWSSLTDVPSNPRGTIAFGEGLFAIGAADVYTTDLPGQEYASQTDLLDDTKAPSPGTYKSYLAGGMFRLGSTPDGLITADVTEGDDASDRTAGQLFTRALEQGGYTSSDWNASDITALDTADDSVCGIFVGEETTLAEVLDKISDTVGAWWGVDRDGTFRIKQLTAPDMADSVLTITANDLLRPLERLAPGGLGGGLPVWRQVVRWGRIYAVQATDIAGSVTDARRGVIGKEWRDAASEDTAVKDDYLLSQQVIRESLYTAAADAAAEALRRVALYKTRRDVFELWLPMNADTVALELGDTIILEHPRYGLEYGAPFLILGAEADAKNDRVALTVWGTAQSPLQNSEALWEASRYSGSGDLLDLTGNGHGAEFPGGTNDPLFLEKDGAAHVYFPGLSGNFASVPDEAALRVTGDIDFRFFFLAPDYTKNGSTGKALLSKYGNSTSRCYFVLIGGGGELAVITTPDGTSTSHVTIKTTDAISEHFAASTWGGVAIAYDVDDGDGGRVCKFYRREDNALDTPLTDESWTLFDTVTGTGTTSIFGGTDDLTIARTEADTAAEEWKFQKVQIRDGIGGDLVFDADFTDEGAYNDDLTELTAATGQTVTINYATSGRKTEVVTRDGFLSGTDDRLDLDDLPTIAYPFALVGACRVHGAPSGMLASLGNTSTADHYVGIGFSSGKPTIVIRAGGSEVAATADDAASAGEDHVLVGVFASKTDRKLYLDGTLVASSTTSADLPTIDTGNLMAMNNGGTLGSYLDAFFASAAHLPRAPGLSEIQRITREALQP